MDAPALLWMFFGAKSLRCTLKSGARGVKLELENFCPVRYLVLTCLERHRSSLERPGRDMYTPSVCIIEPQSWNSSLLLD